MSLDVTFTIGHREIGRLTIQNVVPGGTATAPEHYAYAYTLKLCDSRRTYRGAIAHDYNDGALDLVVDVLASAIARWPKLKSSRRPRNRIRCKRCGDIVESIYRHDYRKCKCGASAVDGGQELIVSQGGEAERAPKDSPLERMIKRLGRRGVIVAYTPKSGFSVTWSTTDGSHELRGASLQSMLEEAFKRTNRGGLVANKGSDLTHAPESNSILLPG